MKRLLLLSLLLTVFIFTSCEKADLTSSDDTLPEAWNKEYLEHYIKQKVIFHYSEVDQKKNKYTGWIIDNRGTISKYETNTKPAVLESVIVTNKDLIALRDLATELSSEVEGQSLVDAFEQMDELKRHQTKLASMITSDEISRSIYAYQDEVLAIGEHPSCIDPARTPEQMFRVALEKEADNQQLINESEGAKIMMRFLTGVKRSVN